MPLSRGREPLRDNPTLPRTQGVQPKVPLTRASIVSAAMRLIEERGAGAFSLRALARALDVFPTALAWHIGDRNALLSEISAQWMRDVVLPQPTGDWKRWMREVARRYREAAHCRPQIAALIGGEFVNGAAAFELPEAIVGQLVAIGVPDDEVADAYNALVGAVVGFVGVELTRAPDRPAAKLHDIERQIRSIDATRYPNLNRHIDRLADRAFSLRWTSGAKAPLDQSFEYLVELLITGIAGRTAPNTV